MLFLTLFKIGQLTHLCTNFVFVLLKLVQVRLNLMKLKMKLKNYEVRSALTLSKLISVWLSSMKKNGHNTASVRESPKLSEYRQKKI